MNLPYEIESFGISDLGLVRNNNEDVFHEIPVHRFFALADGMGGHKAGEIAAREAVHHLSSSVCRLFSSKEDFPSQKEALPPFLHQAILDANRWVHELSEQKEEFSGMGTTLCCCLMLQDSLLYAHVGDSRIYRFRKELERLTEDHSPSPRTNGVKNIITKAVGTAPFVEPDISLSLMEPGDVYFLCSDGLTDYVPDQEISRILTHHSCIKRAAQELVDAAKLKGGSDNITILMIKIINDSTNLP